MESRTKRYSWTQPCCDRCWEKYNDNERIPVRMRVPEMEVCCFCGATSYSGIYIRIDPTTVDHPSLVK